MKAQPGFISTQLHRGTVGSRVLVNVAVWESAEALSAAFGSPDFQQALARYPDGTVARPHLVQKVAVGNICVA
jgi:heme-degrading monooxygenase HmoA